MNPETPNELKFKIKKLKDGIAKRNSLHAKREELEGFLSDTQNKTQNTLLKAYQTNDEMHYSKARDYEKLGQELLEKLRLLDKEIDKWELIEEEDASWLEQKLISSLLEQHPREKQFIDSFNEKKSKWLYLQRNTDRLLALLANLEHLMSTLQITRTRIKRQGIFSYIFGTSPNMMITQCLQGISKVLLEDKNTIANFQKDHSSIREALTELAQYTDELEKECQKRWGYRQLDVFIEKNLLKATSLKSQFEKFHIEIEDELGKLEKELQNWLSQFND